jgi:hypothetical protein
MDAAWKDLFASPAYKEVVSRISSICKMEGPGWKDMCIRYNGGEHDGVTIWVGKLPPGVESKPLKDVPAKVKA